MVNTSDFGSEVLSSILSEATINNYNNKKQLKVEKKRRRFSRNLIGSSEFYRVRAHRQMLLENHNDNATYFASINVEIKPTYFIKCFDKLIPVTLEEVNKMSYTIVEIRVNNKIIIQL